MDAYVDEFKKDPYSLDCNQIENIINKLGIAIDKFNPKDPKLNPKYIKRTNKLYMGLLKIVNLFKNMKKKEKQGQGLKIIAPKQMLSYLPVLLAQIHAGNNSAKLKNEIRQLLYSLYRSKKISKTVYNNLIVTM